MLISLILSFLTIYNVHLSTNDRYVLECVVALEVGDMDEPARTQAALSVIDTIFLRASVEHSLTFKQVLEIPFFLSPITYEGGYDAILAHGCSVPVQWVPHVVDLYLQGNHGLCPGYPHYHSVNGWGGQCVVVDDKGIYMRWTTESGWAQPWHPVPKPSLSELIAWSQENYTGLYVK